MAAGGKETHGDLGLVGCRVFLSFLVVGGGRDHVREAGLRLWLSRRGNERRKLDLPFLAHGWGPDREAHSLIAGRERMKFTEIS